MLAVALMLSSVAVLAGCNKTPAEEIPADNDVVIEEITPVEDEVVADTEVEASTGEEVTPVEEVEPVVIEQPVEVVAVE